MADDRSPHAGLDEAIDRAVREMTSAEPLPEFDERVMRRIEQPSRTPSAWPRLATAAAVAAVVIVLAIALRDDAVTRPPQQQSAPAIATQRAAPTSERSPSVATVEPREPSTGRTVRTTTGARRTADDRMVTAATVTEATLADDPLIHPIAALQEPSALEVQDIRQHAVDVADIAMSQLDIAQLDVQSLRPPDQRREE